MAVSMWLPIELVDWAGMPDYDTLAQANSLWQQELLLWLLLSGFVCAVVGAFRGGNALVWFIAGFCLGPLALLLALSVAGAQCIHCRKRISPKATICPYCRTGSEAAR